MLAALHAAVKAGRCEQMASIIEQGKKTGEEACASSSSDTHLVNQLTSEGWNALRVAVSFNQPIVLQKLLVDYGARDAPPRKEGWSSLHVACFHGFSECVELLLQLSSVAFSGVPGALLDEDGRWPMHCAVQRDHAVVLEHLLMNRGDLLQTTTVSGCTAVHFAARYAAFDCMTLLLSKQRAKRALVAVNRSLRTPLEEAVASEGQNASRCVELLLDNIIITDSSSRRDDARADDDGGINPRFVAQAFMLALRHGRMATVAPFLRRPIFAEAFDRRFNRVPLFDLISILPTAPVVAASEDGVVEAPSISNSSTDGCCGGGTFASACPLHLIVLTFNVDFWSSALELLFRTLLFSANRDRDPLFVSCCSSSAIRCMKDRFRAAFFRLPLQFFVRASKTGTGAAQFAAVTKEVVDGPTCAMLLFSTFNKKPEQAWRSSWFFRRSEGHRSGTKPACLGDGESSLCSDVLGIGFSDYSVLLPVEHLFEENGQQPRSSTFETTNRECLEDSFLVAALDMSFRWLQISSGCVHGDHAMKGAPRSGWVLMPVALVVAQLANVILTRRSLSSPLAPLIPSERLRLPFSTIPFIRGMMSNIRLLVNSSFSPHDEPSSSESIALHSCTSMPTMSSSQNLPFAARLLELARLVGRGPFLHVTAAHVDCLDAVQ